jgi:hypothetical protein
MWALGVMVFEAIAQRDTFPTTSDIRDCAAGRARYPWELPPTEQPPAWRQSRLRGLVVPCLAREGATRPSAEVLLTAVERVGHTTTMRT